MSRLYIDSLLKLEQSKSLADINGFIEKNIISNNSLKSSIVKTAEPESAEPPDEDYDDFELADDEEETGEASEEVSEEQPPVPTQVILQHVPSTEVLKQTKDVPEGAYPEVAEVREQAKEQITQPTKSQITIKDLNTFLYQSGFDSEDFIDESSDMASGIKQFMKLLDAKTLDDLAKLERIILQKQNVVYLITPRWAGNTPRAEIAAKQASELLHNIIQYFRVYSTMPGQVERELKKPDKDERETDYEVRINELQDELSGRAVKSISDKLKKINEATQRKFSKTLGSAENAQKVINSIPAEEKAAFEELKEPAIKIANVVASIAKINNELAETKTNEAKEKELKSKKLELKKELDELMVPFANASDTEMQKKINAAYRFSIKIEIEENKIKLEKSFNIEVRQPEKEKEFSAEEIDDIIEKNLIAYFSGQDNISMGKGAQKTHILTTIAVNNIAETINMEIGAKTPLEAFKLISNWFIKHQNDDDMVMEKFGISKENFKEFEASVGKALNGYGAAIELGNMIRNEMLDSVDDIDEKISKSTDPKQKEILEKQKQNLLEDIKYIRQNPMEVKDAIDLVSNAQTRHEVYKNIFNTLRINLLRDKVNFTSLEKLLQNIIDNSGKEIYSKITQKILTKAISVDEEYAKNLMLNIKEAIDKKPSDEEVRRAFSLQDVSKLLEMMKYIAQHVGVVDPLLRFVRSAEIERTSAAIYTKIFDILFSTGADNKTKIIKDLGYSGHDAAIVMEILDNDLQSGKYFEKLFAWVMENYSKIRISATEMMSEEMAKDLIEDMKVNPAIYKNVLNPVKAFNLKAEYEKNTGDIYNTFLSFCATKFVKDESPGRGILNIFKAITDDAGKKLYTTEQASVNAAMMENDVNTGVFFNIVSNFIKAVVQGDFPPEVKQKILAGIMSIVKAKASKAASTGKETEKQNIQIFGPPAPQTAPTTEPSAPGPAVSVSPAQTEQTTPTTQDVMPPATAPTADTLTPAAVESAKTTEKTIIEMLRDLGLSDEQANNIITNFMTQSGVAQQQKKQIYLGPKSAPAKAPSRLTYEESSELERVSPEKLAENVKDNVAKSIYSAVNHLFILNNERDDYLQKNPTRTKQNANTIIITPFMQGMTKWLLEAQKEDKAAGKRYGKALPAATKNMTYINAASLDPEIAAKINSLFMDDAGNNIMVNDISAYIILKPIKEQADKNGWDETKINEAVQNKVKELDEMSIAQKKAKIGTSAAAWIFHHFKEVILPAIQKYAAASQNK